MIVPDSDLHIRNLADVIRRGKGVILLLHADRHP